MERFCVEINKIHAGQKNIRILMLLFYNGKLVRHALTTRNNETIVFISKDIAMYYVLLCILVIQTFINHFIHLQT